jgi:hypothetical protein
MGRVGATLAIAAVVACGELREAQPSSDAGGPSPTNPSNDAAPAMRDASKDVDASTPASCPAPCEPEQISTMENLGPVTVDSFDAYFGGANGGVWKIPKTGGKTTKLGDGKTTRLALADDQVFWGEGDHLVSCPKTGCGGIPQGLLLDQTGLDEVVSDGTKIVWRAHSGTYDVIRTCPAKQCAPATMAKVAAATSISAGVAIGAGKVFWSDVQSKLHACPLDPLPCNDPAAVGPGTNDAVVFDQTVYWVNQQQIVSCAVDGCASPKKIGTSEVPHLLVADERHLYWREMVNNQILRCPTDGCDGDPEVVAKDVDGIYYGGLALDADYVYWTQKSGLWRRHK